MASSVASPGGTIVNAVTQASITPPQFDYTKYGDTFAQEMQEFVGIQQQIEQDYDKVHDNWRQLIPQQDKLCKKIKEQSKQDSRLLQLSNNDPQVKEYLKKTGEENRRLMRSTVNDGGKFVTMLLGKSHNVILGADKAKNFKQEYEDFKSKMTFVSIPIALVLLFLVSMRMFDTLYQVFLCYFYMSLAIRENILRANGSKIQPWWIRHHYMSILLCITMLTWPQSPIYETFRFWFYSYAVYAGVVQILQYRYQMKRLYVLKTIGRANSMDTANSDSGAMILDEIHFLLVFVFIGQFFQLVNGLYLVREYFSALVGSGPVAEWQVLAVGIQWLILFAGNLYTTVTVYKNRTKKTKRAQEPGSASPNGGKK